MKENCQLRIPYVHVASSHLNLLKLVKEKTRWKQLEIRNALYQREEDIGEHYSDFIETCISRDLITKENYYHTLELDLKLTSKGQIYLVKERYQWH